MIITTEPALGRDICLEMEKDLLDDARQILDPPSTNSDAFPCLSIEVSKCYTYSLVQSLSLSFARAATTAVYDSHDYLLVFVLRGALTCRPKLVARHYRHGERERERETEKAHLYGLYLANILSPIMHW